MKSFLSRFQSLVLFVLAGFDRLRFCGESRLLNHACGVECDCYQQRTLFKDLPEHAEALTKIFRAKTYQQLGDVPRLHLDSPKIDKEQTAMALALKHGRAQGRIVVLTCQESGLTYQKNISRCHTREAGL
jgi:hypothetical protein